MAFVLCLVVVFMCAGIDGTPIGLHIHIYDTQASVEKMTDRMGLLASQNVELSAALQKMAQQKLNMSYELQNLAGQNNQLVGLFSELKDEDDGLKKDILNGLTSLTRKLDCILNMNSTTPCEDSPFLTSISRIHALLTNRSTSSKVDILSKVLFFGDCADIQRHYQTTVNGAYTIHIDGTPVKVYCDFTTDGGGWTVFQRRVDGSTDFFRTWSEYRAGFGDAAIEYWLGNDYLHLMTSLSNYTLRIDLADFEGNRTYAMYNSFRIGNLAQKYKLQISGYSGNAGDAMRDHNGSFFSTKDADNDISLRSCAKSYKGGWWYFNCYRANLNGKFYEGPHGGYADGVEWYHWRGNHYSLKSEMKIRPVLWNV